MITDDDTKAYVAANVSAELARLGWSQVKLATATGENAMTISNVIRGVHVPGAGLLCRIAEALNVSVDTLLSPPNKKPRRSAG